MSNLTLYIAIEVTDLHDFESIADQLNSGEYINIISETSLSKLKDRLNMKPQSTKWLLVSGHLLTEIYEVK